MPATHRVAEEVRVMKARYQVSQETLAQVIGVSQQSTSGKLKGKTPFTIEELDRLARYFGVKISVFFGEPGAGPTPDGGGGLRLVDAQGVNPRSLD